MLNEREKRTGWFDEANSVGVVFADGQTWYLRKPFLEIRPIFKDGVATRSYRALSYSRDIDDAVKLVAGTGGDFEEVAVASATLAGLLLRFHYDLDDDELDQLLAYRPDDAESIGWMAAVVAIAVGKRGIYVEREASNAG